MTTTMARCSPREIREKFAVWPPLAVALVAQAAGQLVELGRLRVVRERELLVLPFWATDRPLELAVVARERAEHRRLHLAVKTTCSCARAVVIAVPPLTQAVVGAQRLGELAANRARAFALPGGGGRPRGGVGKWSVRYDHASRRVDMNTPRLIGLMQGQIHFSTVLRCSDRRDCR